ncbi:hypothetical protein [Roseivivax sp. THAF30]|uniref:hypothetical protein n=1 Tax=Roseivivax sp. THAF30 TaxID=2587852 RepID=UPI001C12C033|nr:hypothetical protein [Roseivivax sp. THAF30]
MARKKQTPDPAVTVTEGLNEVTQLQSEDSTRPKTKQQRWRKRNPRSYLAHITVANALRLGVLTRSPCEVCGSEKSEAHHDDYSSPLEVTWLCRRHHRARHRNP